MELHTQKANYARIHYDALSPQAVKKVLTLDKYLRFHKFYYEGKFSTREVYFDTPENILQEAGILLSKVYRKHKTYFKIEKENFLPSNFRANEKQVYIQPCQNKETPYDHSLSIIDAITTIFTTAFTIDFENVLRNCVPKLEIMIKYEEYKLLSGTSFKAKVFLEKTFYTNYDTRRKEYKDGITVELDSPLSFLPEFEEFTKTIEKYCKELIPFNENRYNIAKKITKAPPVLEKQEKVKKVKKAD